MIKNKDTIANLQKLGANIRRKRNAKEMSQERLAELADLNIRTVQKIEAASSISW